MIKDRIGAIKTEIEIKKDNARDMVLADACARFIQRCMAEDGITYEEC